MILKIVQKKTVSFTCLRLKIQGDGLEHGVELPTFEFRIQRQLHQPVAIVGHVARPASECDFFGTDSLRA